MRKLRGLKALVQDAIEHGSRAVERVHHEVSQRPFQILEQLPVVAGPAKAVHLVHDAVLATTYATLRGVTRLSAALLDVALDVAEQRGQDDQPSTRR